MKFIITIFFLFYFSIVLAQKNEFCRLSEDKLYELCNGIEKNRNNNKSHVEITFYVTAKNAEELETIRLWANNKGYITELSEDANVDTALAVKKKVNVFSCSTHNIIYKDIEQGLDKMGIGCFAVKMDTCQGRRKEDIILFYNEFILTKDLSSQTFYFYQYFSFDFGKEQKIPELTEWAKVNGYKTKERIIEYVSSRTGELIKLTDLTIEKKMGQWDIDYLIKEVNKITEGMIKFKISQLANTGMGISGNSKTD